MPQKLTHTLGFIVRNSVWTLCVLCAATAVSADSTSLIIDIGPRGTVVDLDGPQHLITNSPNSIHRPVSGWYNLRARLSGYETWNTEVYIDGSSPNIISGMLTPKTATSAGIRALFFPGWGHYYSNRNGRGALMTVTSAGLLGGFLYLTHQANVRFDDFKQAERDFDATQSVAEQTLLLPDLAELRRRAYNAESDMRNWGFATVAFHVYQVLDAVIFFPHQRSVDVAGIELGVQLGDRNFLMIGARYGL